jgi:hypothetical protein
MLLDAFARAIVYRQFGAALTDHQKGGKTGGMQGSVSFQGREELLLSRASMILTGGWAAALLACTHFRQDALRPILLDYHSIDFTRNLF